MQVKTANKKTKTEIKIPDTSSLTVLRQYIDAYLANSRQGTSSSKTRSEVRGSGRKIWKQKGTGRARHGDRYANLFVGGGVAFGPKPKDWSKKVPKAIKTAALVTALREKKDSIVISEPIKIKQPSTKKAKEFLNNLGLETGNILLVTNSIDKNVVKSFNNLPKVILVLLSELNAFDVARADHIVMESGVEKTLEERVSK